MATYDSSIYSLYLNMGADFYRLEVIDDEDQVVETYNLRGGSAVTLGYVAGDYIIGSGDAISTEELPHKHKVGGSNTQGIAGKLLSGIGIVDLRDMGKQGLLSTIYDLECCGELRLQGMDGAYPLWIKVPETDCVEVTDVP